MSSLSAHRDRLAAVLPTFGLRVTSGDVELRLPDDAELLAVADVAADGVHAPDSSPFLYPWTRGAAEEVRRNVLTYHWSARGAVEPERWALELGVYLDGEIAGIPSVSAQSFLATRGDHGFVARPAVPGSGLGRRMRLLVLHLAFEGLGAREPHSEAFEDNPPSNAVSRRLGYAPNGVRTVERDGAPVLQQKYLLTRAAWDARPEACGLTCGWRGSSRCGSCWGSSETSRHSWPAACGSGADGLPVDGGVIHIFAGQRAERTCVR